MNTEVVADKGSQNIIIRRSFSATIQSVFKAFMDPDLYAEWAGPPNGIMEIEKFQPDEGGSYLIHQKNEIGQTFSFYGVFHEITNPSLIVRTSEFKGLPQKLLPVLEIYEFNLNDLDRTEIKITIVCPSEEYRDGML